MYYFFKKFSNQKEFAFEKQVFFEIFCHLIRTKFVDRTSWNKTGTVNFAINPITNSFDQGCSEMDGAKDVRIKKKETSKRERGLSFYRERSATVLIPYTAGTRTRGSGNEDCQEKGKIRLQIYENKRHALRTNRQGESWRATSSLSFAQPKCCACRICSACCASYSSSDRIILKCLTFW